jgi:flagella basal body P-ring formation protein FlgA
MSGDLSRVRLFGHLLVVQCLLTPASGGAGQDPQADPLLQIHLPREVTVENNALNLGQITVVRGDGSVVARAGRIGLGRLALPGQRLVLDRPTILGRLASSGIPAERVRLTGAQAVTVRRRHEIIKGDEFIELAQAFLKQSRPSHAVAESVALGRPKDLIAPDQAESIEVTPRLVRDTARGLVTVRITVTADGQEVGVRSVPLRLRYHRYKIVTSQAVEEGTVLTPENVKIQSYVADRPDPAGWKPPYGLKTVRALPANVEVRPDMVRAAQPELVIQRNETVVVRVERPGFVVTAMGIALQQARAGEFVKVRNTDSLRVIVCKVNADGTVTPVF